MPFVFKRLALLMSIAAVLAPDKAAPADKDQAKFTVGPAAGYPAHQTSEKVTVAADAYDTADKTRTAFGKLKLDQYGILPILLVIQNDSGQSLRIDRIRVDYVAPNGSHVDATPARDVRYLSGTRKPNVVTGPLPTAGPRISRRKNPLDAWEIEGRAFSAKMIPPGESASGFFYFQTGHRASAKLYVTGITEASSGRDLLYFEFPLTDPAR
jgi:hypothetical protein